MRRRANVSYGTVSDNGWDRRRALAMKVTLQRFSVGYEYPVYFGRGVFEPSNSALVEAIRRREPERRHRVGVVVEQRVSALWPGLVERIQRYVSAHAGSLELAAPPWIEPGGEASKNDPAVVGRLQALFESWRLDRQSIVVVVGGGGLQDTVGYAAATTHRGVRLVRVPTTVLSQNDSGVGVKNGINAFGKKNFLGTFAPPFAVLDDFRFLETLDLRDRAAGMAEAVKVALVKDAGFFDWLERSSHALRSFEDDAVAHMIQRCATLHLRHIAEGGDPFELGSSRPLDFGHWAAHKLESLTGYGLRHGEAVAIGLALDTRYSALSGLLPEGDDLRVVALIEALGLPIYDPELEARHPDGRRMIFDGIDEFREHLGGNLTVMMLEGIGHGREVTDLDSARIDEAIEWLSDRSSKGRPSAATSRCDGGREQEAAGG